MGQPSLINFIFAFLLKWIKLNHDPINHPTMKQSKQIINVVSFILEPPLIFFYNLKIYVDRAVIIAYHWDKSSSKT